ncbi:hypothetical protein [Flavobacterium sp. UMI-01]|uniref:hypothetical protein n=1 Tax=Flavobacterium sp. UMI-01 TaxID=1441053 RepID=UPI001C7CC57F|nr:hypothetical protein [Flavobacterium sp. UMI-01]GIZ09970.1 hypothetical protein FUMI01_26960 [Flavobacterium sp. UMI-01]
MKLIAPIYVSPLDSEGQFQNVEINDTEIIIQGENFFSVKFDMTYQKNDRTILLGSHTLSFLGDEGDEQSSNRTTKISILNPEYDSEDPESKPRLTVPMLAYIAENGMPEDYQMVDWGFPTAEKARQMFTGGSLDDPRVELTDPFARQWLLNTLNFKGEKAIVQFQFV